MSSFTGINTALSAIRARQAQMNTTGHNIANANTEGYRRQDVILTSSVSSGVVSDLGRGIAQLGTGVSIGSIQRAQTDFVDAQIRITNQQSGNWSARNTMLAQLEPVLAEPGDSGLSATLNQFWNSWEDLTASPESVAARTAVAENGAALADRIRNMNYNITNMQTQVDNKVKADVSDINEMATEIASLNELIAQPKTSTNPQNDLLDKRDLLIEQLSQFTDIQVHGSGGADTIISIGGKILVQGNQTSKIDLDYTSGHANPVWANDGTPVIITSGELRGYIDVRDQTANNYLTMLDKITSAIVTRVNEIHSTGATYIGSRAGNFFVPGSTSANIQIESVLLNYPSYIAAGAFGNGKNDNSISNQIAGIRREALVDGQTIGAAYTTLIAQIGANTADAKTQSEVQDSALSQRKSQRESIAGVSLDEEMVNMVKFQQSYNAAARILTVMNEMIDTIINRMGSG